jgi:prepilin-type N-terminal cleavage/methylation domain-containing protein
MGRLLEGLRAGAVYWAASRKTTAARGYTLLELLLTLSILGVLLAVAVPSFTHLFSERRANYTAAEVQRVLRATQQLATAQAGRFRRVEARFSFGEGPRADLWGVPWQDWLPAVPLGSVGLGAPTTTVRRSGALEFTVAFAASGSPLPGSQGTLEVADGAAVRYVVVAAVTGRVRASSTP